MNKNFKNPDLESTEKAQTIIILSYVCCPFSHQTSHYESEKEKEPQLEESQSLISDSTEIPSPIMPKF